MRKYLIILEKTKIGFSAYVPDLPGCIATGKTKQQVEKLIYEGIEFHLEGLKEYKQPIPKSATEAYNVLVSVR
jgi:predicted RNase H-like HicB family nuclease